ERLKAYPLITFVCDHFVSLQSFRFELPSYHQDKYGAKISYELKQRAATLVKLEMFGLSIDPEFGCYDAIPLPFIKQLALCGDDMFAHFHLDATRKCSRIDVDRFCSTLATLFPSLEQLTIVTRERRS